MPRSAASTRTAAAQRFLLRSLGDGINFVGALARNVDIGGKSLYSFVPNTGVFTLIGIYKPNNTNPVNGIMGNTILTTEKGFAFFTDGNRKLQMIGYNGSGNAFSAVSLIGLPVDYLNKTFLFIASSNGGTTITFSVGNFETPMLHDARASAASLSAGDMTNNLTLGRASSTFGPGRAEGLEWHIYNTELSQAEKDTFHLTGQLPSGLVGSKYVIPSGASGATITDSGSFANNGTLTSVAYTSDPMKKLKPRSAAASRAPVS